VAEECDTGIRGVGKIAWGSHFCNFYDGQIDLADCVVPFFKAGLDFAITRGTTGWEITKASEADG